MSEPNWKALYEEALKVQERNFESHNEYTGQLKARIELLEDQLKGEKERSLTGFAEQSKLAVVAEAKANECGRLLLQGMKTLEAYKDRLPNEDVGDIDYSDFKSKVYELIADLDIAEAVDVKL